MSVLKYLCSFCGYYHGKNYLLNVILYINHPVAKTLLPFKRKGLDLVSTAVWYIVFPVTKPILLSQRKKGRDSLHGE